MAKPILEFKSSMRKWMRQNEVEEIKVFKTAKGHRLIKGDDEVLFLAKKLADFSDVDKLQVVTITNSDGEFNHCLCSIGSTLEEIGVITAG